MQHLPTALASHPANETTNAMTFNEVLLPFAIFSSLGGSIYFITKITTEYQLKKRMIDKGYVNEESQSIFKKHILKTENRHAPLKWALLLFTGGASLVAMEYLDVRPNSPLPYGLVAASVSLGFLVYYIILRKDIKP